MRDFTRKLRNEVEICEENSQFAKPRRISRERSSAVIDEVLAGVKSVPNFDMMRFEKIYGLIYIIYYIVYIIVYIIWSLNFEIIFSAMQIK